MQQPKVSFDLLVIGAGSGGIATAMKAAKLGQKVCLIEQDQIGGTCINSGCMPKKIMWLTSKLHASINNAHKYGVITKSVKFNWHKLLIVRKEFASDTQKNYVEEFEKLGITLIKGAANFIDENIVAINQQLYFAKFIVIATGAKPIIPDTLGAKFGLTSNDFFKLKSQPKNIVIAGGGYIGLELACILNNLGTIVTVVIRGKTILKGFDNEVAGVLQENMKKQGINIIQNTEIEKIKKDGLGLGITLKNHSIVLKTEALIWAIGREPNIQQLGLENIGLDVDKNGFIEINEYHQTSSNCVYAIGDVTNRPALTPVAIKAGRYLAEHLFGNESVPLQLGFIPSVIFSQPPYASIGLSENKAKEDALPVKIYKKVFVETITKLENQKLNSIVKLIVCEKTDKILGCHILASGSEEILQGFAVATEMGATMKDFRKCLAIHPIVAEELVLME